MYYICMHTSVNAPSVQKATVTTKHEATLGSRGGIQIPVEVRKRLNLKPNDKVVFRVTEQEITVDAEPAVTLKDLYWLGHIQGTNHPRC